MPKYLVVLERLIEEEVFIEADSELEAIDMVLSGEGELENFDEWAPSVTFSTEVPDDTEQ